MKRLAVILVLGMGMAGCAAKRPLRPGMVGACEPVAFSADGLREPTIVVCRWADGRVRVWKWTQ